MSTYRIVLERYEPPPADKPHRRRWRQVLVSKEIELPDAVPFDVDLTPAAPGPAWEWPDEQ